MILTPNNCFNMGVCYNLKNTKKNGMDLKQSEAESN